MLEYTQIKVLDARTGDEFWDADNKRWIKIENWMQLMGAQCQEFLVRRKIDKNQNEK